MHPFAYAAPSTVKEAVEILTKHGEKARPMAGGTDLLVQIRGGKFDLDMVVDIKKIPELTKVTNNNEGLVIGSAVACHQLYDDDEISKNYPGLIDAATLIGGIQIQSRSGFGGNLCNATPSADGIGPLIVHSAVANIQGESGARSIPVEEFCTGPGRNALGKGEMLVSLSLPNKGKGFGAAYERFIPRNEMDIAVAAVASSIIVGEDGKIREARELLCSQVRADEMEELFRWMYDNLELWSSSDEGQDSAILTIRKGLVNHSMVSDPEINLSATLVELAQIDKK